MFALIEFPSTSCIDIGIVEDDENEGSESFFVDVFPGDPAVVIGTNSVATVTIMDDVMGKLLATF